jgi:hypothetical protein
MDHGGHTTRLARHIPLSSCGAAQKIGIVLLATRLRRRTKGIQRVRQVRSGQLCIASFHEQPISLNR